MPDNTNPAAPGPQTSEHGLTQWVAYVSTAVAAASVVVAGAGSVLSGLHDVFPTAGWVTAAVGVVGGLASLLGVVAKYTGGRSDVKVAMLNLQAAQAVSARAAAPDSP